jgi:outer membrane protein OmpA-like peptidoglycan-associated protein
MNVVKRWVFASVLILAVSGAAGCVATRDFVRHEVGQRDLEIARHDTALEVERARIGALDSKVMDVGSRADDAGRRADRAAAVGGQALNSANDAGARAQQALAKAEDTDNRFKRAWANRNKRATAETVIVRFRFNRADLDDRAQTTLLNAIKMLDENPDTVVAVQGYTDSAGPQHYNLQLSQRRAETVRRFMVQHGVDMLRIQSIGMGEMRTAAAQGRGRAQGRQVAVHLVTPAE